MNVVGETKTEPIIVIAASARPAALGRSRLRLAAGLGAAALDSAGGGVVCFRRYHRLGLAIEIVPARLMSERVRRPSEISAPDRLSKSSASSRIDLT